jgi:hypothetical protein
VRRDGPPSSSGPAAAARREARDRLVESDLRPVDEVDVLLAGRERSVTRQLPVGVTPAPTFGSHPMPGTGAGVGPVATCAQFRASRVVREDPGPHLRR